MNIYDINVLDKEGNCVSLEKYKGNLLLVINSATGCGFTPQYEALQAMYDAFKDEGFVILDFPCNQFGNQAPGTDSEITQFCQARYNMTFPQFKKLDVNGENESELFKFLKANSKFEGFDLNDKLGPLLDQMLRANDPNYDKNTDIKWNFTKFLVDRNGNVVRRFEPTFNMDELCKIVKESL